MRKHNKCGVGFCLINLGGDVERCKKCSQFNRAIFRRVHGIKSMCKPPMPPEPKECPTCHTWFIDRHNKNYCTLKCAKKAYRDRKSARTTEGKLKIYEWRTCQICGQHYYPHTDDQKTCGGKCSAEYMMKTYGRGIHPASSSSSRHPAKAMKVNHPAVSSSSAGEKAPMAKRTRLEDNEEFLTRLERHEGRLVMPVELAETASILDASCGWWRTLSFPRQAVIFDITFAAGSTVLFTRCRRFLQLVHMGRYDDARMELLSAQRGTRFSGPRGAELGRQMASGVWQDDILAPTAVDDDDEDDVKFERGSLL